MPKVTILDVARLAGVSTATVSRAMHSPQALRPDTLERVHAAIRACGYVYNATAGDFSRRRSTVIGVLILSTNNKVAASLSAAQEVAAKGRFPLLVSTSDYDPAQEKAHLRQFLQRGVAGLLVIGHLRTNRGLIQELQSRGIPCVFLWESLPGAAHSYVGIDNLQAAYSMVSQLLDQGYERIGFICGAEARVEAIRQRYAGYAQALRARGLPLDENIVCRMPASSLAKGKAAMQSLMALPEPPRCVCCASDVLAIGAMAAVHEAGLTVPYDYSIAGFDNIEISSYISPALSTVDVPGGEMGRLGMEALLRLITDEDPSPIQKTLPTPLMLRASTCPAAGQKPWQRANVYL